MTTKKINPSIFLLLFLLAGFTAHSQQLARNARYVFTTINVGFSSSQDPVVNLFVFPIPQTPAFYNNYNLIDAINQASCTYTIRPQVAFGGGFTNNWNTFGLGGFEADISKLSYSSIQKGSFQNDYGTLTFEGEEWRWKLRMTFGIQYKKVTFLLFYGVTSGFAKDYARSLTLNINDQITYLNSKEDFRKTDFSLLLGASFRYKLSKSIEFALCYDLFVVTTHKYRYSGIFQTFKYHGFLNQQVGLRCSYLFPEKAENLP